MTDLSAQRRLAADVLDVGTSRIRFDQEAQDEIADAITRDDVRELIEAGSITAVEPKGNSRGRARERARKRAYGHRKGPGSRQGKKGGRQDPKEDWRSRIRAQRRTLREYRDSGRLDRSAYRQLYNQASGGEFDSVRDLERYIENNYDVGGDR